MKSVFITGTSTDIGKTLVSAWLALHWPADYWKPIQTGMDSEQPSDSQVVQLLTNCHVHPEAYCLQAALSPHEAARLENRRISLSTIRPPLAPRLIIEGAGGLLVPLNNQETMADLIKHLQVPILIVASSQLGTINHTCLTLEAARHRGLDILGVILNGPSNPANKAAIEHYGQSPVLAEMDCADMPDNHRLGKIPLPQTLKTRLEALF